MNLEDLVYHTSEGLLDEEMLDSILVLYASERSENKFDKVQNEFNSSLQFLDSVLNDEEKLALHDIEEIHWRNMILTINYGFKHGLFLFFSQFFDKNTSDIGFENFLSPQLNNFAHKKYSDNLFEISRLNIFLCSDLDAPARLHVASVLLEMNEQLYAVFRYSLYLGYNYANSVITLIDTLNAQKMFSYISALKRQLGFSDKYI